MGPRAVGMAVALAMLAGSVLGGDPELRPKPVTKAVRKIVPKKRRIVRPVEADEDEPAPVAVATPAPRAPVAPPPKPAGVVLAYRWASGKPRKYRQTISVTGEYGSHSVIETLTEVVSRAADGSLTLKQTTLKVETTLEDGYPGRSVGEVATAAIRPQGGNADGSAVALDAAIVQFDARPIEVGSSWDSSATVSGYTTHSTFTVEALNILLPGIYNAPCVRLSVRMRTTGDEYDSTSTSKCWFDPVEGILVRYEASGGAYPTRTDLTLIP